MTTLSEAGAMVGLNRETLTAAMMRAAAEADPKDEVWDYVARVDSYLNPSREPMKSLFIGLMVGSANVRAEMILRATAELLRVRDE